MLIKELVTDLHFRINGEYRGTQLKKKCVSLEIIAFLLS